MYFNILMLIAFLNLFYKCGHGHGPASIPRCFKILSASSASNSLRFWVESPQVLFSDKNPIDKKCEYA